MILLRKLFEIFSSIFLTSSDHPRPKVFCLYGMLMMKKKNELKHALRLSLTNTSPVRYSAALSFVGTRPHSSTPSALLATALVFRCVVGTWLALVYVAGCSSGWCADRRGVNLVGVDVFDRLQLDKRLALDELQLVSVGAADFPLKFKGVLVVKFAAAQFRKTFACEFADGGEAALPGRPRASCWCPTGWSW